MLEVDCPNVGMPSSKAGWFGQTDFLNGGSSLRRSTAGSKRYEMTWNSVSRDDARNILDLADRIHGTGEIYWLDPFVADKNMLPQQWASPMQGLFDGLPLSGGERGVARLTPDVNNFPVQSIEYDILGTETPRTIWVPIPAGYTAYIGVFGADGTGGKVIAKSTIGTGYGLDEDLEIMPVSETSRYNHTVSAEDGFDGVELRLGGVGTVTLSGMMVQVLKDGKTPESGGFISGQGHSGCQFTQQPDYTPYSSVFDNVALVASFVETGAWEQ